MTKQLEQFERYAAAVAADRYRVTCIRMQPDGTKQTFILDKKDGVTRGFTTSEIAERMPEMLRLQQRGENIYYTPLSEKKHHILIDDMNREKLERLIRDGYRPAVVLESSPGNCVPPCRRLRRAEYVTVTDKLRVPPCRRLRSTAYRWARLSTWLVGVLAERSAGVSCAR